MKTDFFIICAIFFLVVVAQFIRLVAWSYQPGIGVVWTEVFSDQNLRFFWTTALVGIAAFFAIEGVKYVKKLLGLGKRSD